MLVVFRVGDGRFAVNVEHVQRATRVGKITPLVDSPAAVLGVADVQGQPLIVISGKVKLGASTDVTRPGEKAPILIITTSVGPVTLLVDKIEGVLPPDADARQTLPGVVRVQTQLVTYVEPDHLLDPAIKHLLLGNSLLEAAEAI